MAEDDPNFICNTNVEVMYAGTNNLSDGPSQAKKCLRACTKSANSHHSVYAQSLIRAFALDWNSLKYPMILLADNEGPDQTVRMHWLI